MEAPADYKTSGTFMLISGIITVMSSLVWTLSLIWVCVGVFWVFPLVVGIFEIVVGAGAMQGQPKPNAKTVSILGLVGAVLCGNVVGIVLEILALVNLGKPEVAGWLNQTRF